MTHRSPFSELLHRLGRDNDQAIRMVFITPEKVDSPLIATEHLEAAIELRTDERWNTYFEINPSSYTDERGRSSARHITRLAALYVDIDYKDGGMGSIDGARQLIDDLTVALGVPPAAVVRTGNGLQPYWPVADGEITTDTRGAVALTAGRWKALVDTFAAARNGKVDSLFDLPRIFRVPGSMNWKQLDDPKPVVAEFPDGWEPFTLAELAEIFDEYGAAATVRDVSDTPIAAPDEWEWAPHDCQFVAQFAQEVRAQVVGGRHPWMLAKVAMLHGMIRYGCITEQTFYEMRELVAIRHTQLCLSQEPVRQPKAGEFDAALRWGSTQASLWTETQLIDEMRSHTHVDFMQMFTSGVEVNVTPVAPKPEAPVISLFTKQPMQQILHAGAPTVGALALTPQAQARLTVTAHTDSGNAELFAQSVAGRFIHVSGTATGWHMWDGVRWMPDIGGRHREALKDLFTQRLMNEIDPQEVAWLTSSLNASRMNATLKWAESVPGVQVYPHELDCNMYELVTPQGIVDLKAGTLRPANPLQDRNTKITSVGPDWTRKPLRFLQVIEWAFGHDPYLVGYIQRLFGLALIGEQRAQIFPIFLGSGANGKSLIFHIILGVLGGYGMKLGQQFLVQTRTEQHPEQLAALRGVRLALASEVGANAKFNEELVKAITGDETIRARLMRENSSEFTNTTTLMLAANHLPAVSTGGPAWWRRVRRIDMPKVMPEEQQDDTLKNRILAEEGPGVLAWMIDGARQFLEHGESVPESVRRGTAAYRAEEDALARYIDTRLVFEDLLSTTRQAIYSDYQMWANMNRILPVLSEPKFVREFLTIHPSARIEGDDVYFGGVRLASRATEASFDPIAAALGL